jgi:prepilin-type N-terminal cleavage/methylation domain-containing protein
MRKTTAQLRSTSGTRDSTSRRAFTIIELIVVVVLLGVAATMIVPRVTDTAGRRVRASAERVSETLSALARRDAMLSQPLALTFDRENARLRVLALFRDAQRDTVAWREDGFLPDATLEDAVLVSVQSDGAELDATNLRVEFDQYQPRPALRVVLSDAKGNNLWSVELASASQQADVTAGDIRRQPGATRVIDLDEEGKERVAW